MAILKKKPAKVVFNQAKSDKYLADVKKMTAKRKVNREKAAKDRMDRAVQAGIVGRFSDGTGVGY